MCACFRVLLYNYNVLENFHLVFLKRTINVKMSINTSIIYAETGHYPLTIFFIQEDLLKINKKYAKTNTVIYKCMEK